MRKNITEILESLHIDENSMQKQASNWSPDEINFSKDKFETILTNLEGIKK